MSSTPGVAPVTIDMSFKAASVTMSFKGKAPYIIKDNSAADANPHVGTVQIKATVPLSAVLKATDAKGATISSVTVTPSNSKSIVDLLASSLSEFQKISPASRTHAVIKAQLDKLMNLAKAKSFYIPDR